MARPNKLYEKPRITTIATNDLVSVGQLQSDGTYKVKTITKKNARASLIEPIEVTYSALNTLGQASLLEVGAWYKITNATTANFNLYVQAIAVNKIGCDAKDPLYPNDVVKYNFASNVITWRWDTVNDISAGEDWRNSNDISIGTGCTNIHIGQNSSGNIPNNSSNVIIGKNVQFIFNPTDTPARFEIKDDVSACDFTNSSNVLTASNKVVLLNNDGNPRIVFWDSDNVLQNVALNV